FVANETEKVDKYISGLPDNIYGNVKSARPKTLDETIELANDLMDQKLRTYAERQSDNKRRADDSSRNNHGHQQQPFKRQNVAKVYNMGTGERKPYGGSLPKCNKCHLHHNGPCTQRCHKCNKIGHFARDCRNTGNTNVANTQKGNGATPKGNGCFECGAPGHFKRDCPKLKNKDGGNGNAQGWVYAVGNAEKRGNAPGNPDANVVTGTFLLNNHYASILFDTGADRSFISTAFSSLINIAPTSLENCYDVELADGKLVKIDTIIRGCTLNFLGHPFNIDLMPVELGSFDVIIGMDWLRRCHAVIVCDEKLVQVPYGNETLTFRGNESSNGRESRLTVISCSKAQEYMAKGCQVFLAQISAKKEEDKSERKQIEDVPIVRDFPEVFPEDLPGLPPARPVEFQIDLIPGAAPAYAMTWEVLKKKMTDKYCPQAFWSRNSMNSSDPSPSCRPTKLKVPKELPKVSMVNTCLKKLKHHLVGFDVVVKERTTTTTITKGSWGFEHTKACFRDEISPFAVEQHSLESKTFEVKMNQVLNENERLLEQVISKDIVNIIVNSSVDNASVNMHECKKYHKLETELLNKKDFIDKETYDKLFRRYTTLEKHCISLEVDTQLNHEIFQMENSISNHNKVKKDIEEIETINIELDHRVSKLIAENEHLKQTYKQLYESIKPTRIRSKEQCDALINQVNQKSVEISDLNVGLQEKDLVITAFKDELRKLKGKDLADNVVKKHRKQRTSHK
ncbi:putative reverse transcriptase domain-containing protein, partial [Tanacetum coccineum]